MTSVAVLRIAPSRVYYQPYLKSDPAADFEARLDGSRDYQIVSPQRADYVLCPDLLFFQNGHKQCRYSDIVSMLRQYGDRMRFYDTSDNPVPSLCGGYVSLEKSMTKGGYNCSVPYISNHIRGNPHLSRLGREYLWSFMGSPGSIHSKGYQLRQELLKLKSERCFVADSSNVPVWSYDTESLRLQSEAAARMTSVMRNSKYVACPRGGGPTSMRFYESMACGAVPILLGDTWQIPQIPGLSEAILVVPQADVVKLTDLVTQDEKNWELRQSIIADLYNRFFCEDKIGDTILHLITQTQPTFSGQLLDSMRLWLYFYTKRKILRLSARALTRR